MAILQKDKLKLALEQNELKIESTDRRFPFDPNQQLKSDTIDLRLGRKALTYKTDLSKVDTLSGDPDSYFEQITIPLSGYVLKPGAVIFCSTLEVVCILNGSLCGRVSSRGTFSRFGISVTCGKTRFPPGTPGTPDLQIANHSSVPIAIYPFSYIVQMQIETMDGMPEPYDGVYPRVLGPVPPSLSQRDREVRGILSAIQNPGNPVASEADAGMAIVDTLDQPLILPKQRFITIRASKKVRSLAIMVASVVATLIVGYIVNMVSQDDWSSHWKRMSFVFAMLLGVLTLVVAAVVIFADDE